MYTYNCLIQVNSPSPPTVQSYQQPQNIPECKTYHLLDNPERQSSNTKKPSGGWYCDRKGYSTQSPDWKGKGWYRFKYGSKIPRNYYLIPNGRCGLHIPGYLVGSYPETVGDITTAKVCFKYGSNDCYKESPTKIRNCGSFFVYEFQEAPWCQLGYCAA